MLLDFLSHVYSKMDFSTVSFILTTSIAGFIAFNASMQPKAAIKPPSNKFTNGDTESHPGSEKRSPSPPPVRKDTLAKLYIPQFMNVHGYIALFGCVYFLTIIPRFVPGRMSPDAKGRTFSTISDYTCPHPNNLSAAAFTWNLGTAFNLLAVIIGGCLRLEAFAQLGESFTYPIRRPRQLITSGLYQKMQHPGSTGMLLCWFGMTRILFRMDSIPACFLSEGSFWLEGLKKYLPSALHFLACVWFIAVRTSEEERVLRDSFGQQWTRWHKATKRFVPYLF